MSSTDALLQLAKEVAVIAGESLMLAVPADASSYVHSAAHPREIKAVADRVMDEQILAALSRSGVAILSEESGYVPGRDNSDLRFIVDPLDGTFNFVKGLGPSAVSIALWDGLRPLFGVVFSMPRRQLFWGGPGLGAHRADDRIAVSAVENPAQASICTGIPSRLELDGRAVGRLGRLVSAFGKIRMLGSAAVSLSHVADGSADAYSEQNIMLWDVAAGIALVEGAGGTVRTSPGTIADALDVLVTNGRLPIDAIESSLRRP